MSKINTIKATSRISTKIGNTYYTFEYSEERQIEDGDILENERIALWDTCNNEVDNQVQDVLSAYKDS